MIMAWVKLDTSYLRNPKVVHVSAHAKLLHIASILWTAEHLTDGFVPFVDLGVVASGVTSRPTRAKKWSRELVACGLWDELPTGWAVHDFGQHNRQSLRANVEASREANNERLRRWREKQRRFDDE